MSSGVIVTGFCCNGVKDETAFIDSSGFRCNINRPAGVGGCLLFSSCTTWWDSPAIKLLDFNGFTIQMVMSCGIKLVKAKQQY